MLNNDIRLKPPVLLILAVLVFLTALLSRDLSSRDEIPAFLPNKQKKLYVELSLDGSASKVYQINDGSSVCDVIKLTNIVIEASSFPGSVCNTTLVNGERLHIRKKGLGIEMLEKGWMGAGKRMALSIPLHADRMTRNDWTALPGVGVKLAERIDMYRQKNGEFGSLNSLIRVKGIGPKRIKRWELFFADA